MVYDFVYAPVEGLEIGREVGKELIKKKMERTGMSGKKLQQQGIILSNERLKELGYTDKDLLKLGLLPKTAKN